MCIMNNRSALLAFLLTVVWAACSRQNTYQPDMLIRYAQDIHSINLKGFEQAIILQNNICGSCTGFTFDFLRDNAKSSSCKTLFILSKHDSIIISDLEKWYESPHIVVDNHSLLSRYGLQLSKDSYYCLNNGIVMGYSEIREERQNALDDLQRKQNCVD